METRSLWAVGALGLGALIFFGTSKAKAATPPVRRYSPPAAGPGPVPSSQVPAMLARVYDGSVRLSPHFMLGEWLHAPITTYKLSQDEFDNVQALVAKILEPLRVAVDPSIIEITGGGRPLSFKLDAPMTVTNWKTKAAVTVPAGSSIDDIIRAQGYSPVADSDHHRFACADFVIKTNEKPDTAKMVQAFSDLQQNPAVRQVGLYKVGDEVTHLHVAVIHPGHGKIEGTNFAYQTGEGE